MKKIIFAAVAATVAMSAAQAQMISKPYVGVGVTTTKHDLNVSGATTTEGGDRNAAGKIFIGADITPTFGVEAGHSQSSDDHRVTVGTLSGNAETRSRRSYLAAKATMPVTEQFSVYGKLGAVHTKDRINTVYPGLNYSESDNGVYAGIGGQYNMNEKVALVLEYERNGKKRDFGAKTDAVTVGARYSF
ncbi:porin family protein [Massilia sp. PAMC28688]|uniref:porin family protein n=1 Tax=Massilia sp. PAMC28688 TaxID=2861283 RepID=UPI001C62771E|nr:porin family protein [Massilia sp. PAMC28688]QYF95122.1 porin family protein [Massilia sp. PAMC28688]